VSPNVLSQRLDDLESAGVVRRRILEPPASVPVYELTDHGRALEPVLIELGRWGSREPVTASREMSSDALLVALKTVFDPSSTDGVFALNMDRDWYQVVVSAGSIEISRSRPAHPSATFETDVGTLRKVAFGREPLAAAERAGRMVVTGDRDLAERFTRMFPVDQPGPPRGRDRNAVS
jgi:DNA-binding MarR family transcriptional regulator